MLVATTAISGIMVLIAAISAQIIMVETIMADTTITGNPTLHIRPIRIPCLVVPDIIIREAQPLRVQTEMASEATRMLRRQEKLFAVKMVRLMEDAFRNSP